LLSHNLSTIGFTLSVSVKRTAVATTGPANDATPASSMPTMGRQLAPSPSQHRTILASVDIASWRRDGARPFLMRQLFIVTYANSYSKDSSAVIALVFTVRLLAPEPLNRQTAFGIVANQCN
jgi:hypothetical protein